MANLFSFISGLAAGIVALTLLTRIAYREEIYEELEERRHKDLGSEYVRRKFDGTK